MTKQLQVLLGVKALVAAALPLAQVIGFDADAERPDRIGADGTLIGYPGDPGEPEIDLSPLAYNYAHRIEIELALPQGSSSADLDAALGAVGAAVAADRTLGGLCDWLDVDAATLGDATGEMVSSVNWAGCCIVASYATSNPLG